MSVRTTTPSRTTSIRPLRSDVRRAGRVALVEQPLPGLQLHRAARRGQAPPGAFGQRRHQRHAVEPERLGRADRLDGEVRRVGQQERRLPVVDVLGLGRAAMWPIGRATRATEHEGDDREEPAVAQGTTTPGSGGSPTISDEDRDPQDAAELAGAGDQADAVA